jgi:glycosyltransferase involved in cell wall biosynthesis
VGVLSERLACEDSKLLSICVPTFNRCERIVELVQGLLDMPGSFEICVHDDGSNDDTLRFLRSICDSRLVVSSAKNQGRSAALVEAISNARGNFIMLFDDDDSLSTEGLMKILADCKLSLPAGCVGYIYHLSDVEGDRIGTDFPVTRANFLSLRADYGVVGDKKEVVRADALKSVLYKPDASYRRTPTSLLWAKLALKYDVICRNESVGIKVYLPSGMSSAVRRLKVENAYPQVLQKAALIKGYFFGRYHSIPYAGRAVIGVAYYSILVLWAYAKRSACRYV